MTTPPTSPTPPVGRLHAIIKSSESQDPEAVMAAIVWSGDVEAALALFDAQVVVARLRAAIKHVAGQGDRTKGHHQSTRDVLDVHVREHDRHKPGHAPKRSPAAKRALAKSAAASLFNTIKVRGRPLGDVLYGEMEASIRLCRTDGVDNLRLAFLQKRLFESVPYNPALEKVPARQWATEETLRAATERWNQMADSFPRLTVHQIEQVLQLERPAAA
jgi:hypothetical protein